MKKILSFLLAVVLLMSVVPLGASTLTASAAANGVQLKIEKIKKVYSTGTYFTSTGQPHQAQGPNCPDDCMICSINGIPARGELPSGASMGYSRYNWQCYAFALYTSTYIFGSYFRNWGTVPVTSAVVGDVVEFDWDYNGSVDHYALVLYREGSNLVVYDANVDWYCKVSYGSVYNIGTAVKVYRAPNYNAVNGSGDSSPTYENIEQGTYGIKNNSTGTYLSVSYGIDQNEQNVDLYNELNVATKMIITKASTGYKIRPQCCASRIINPFGDTVRGGLNVNIYNDVNDSSQWWVFQKVSNGYVIRNVQNTNCVLDVNNGNVIVSNYTGATTQIWTLNNLTHTHSYGSWQVRKAATCAATGVEFRVCSCGREETRTTAKISTHTYNNSYDTKCNICGVARVIVRYPDMSQNAWYTEAVGYVSKTGIMTGYSNGLFGVSDSIQRQDFLVMLARISGVNLNSYKYKSKFPDVARNSYYEAAVNWGVEKGIVTGYQNGKFGVGDKVTREQLVTFLHRYAKYKGYNYSYSSNRESAVSGQYKDYKNVSGFAKAPVLWAIEKGVISGKTSTTIAPHGNAQRCEVAQIMYNIYLKNIFR